MAIKPDELMTTGVIQQVHRNEKTGNAETLMIAVLGTNSVLKVYPPRPGQVWPDGEGGMIKLQDHPSWHWNTGDFIEIRLTRSDCHQNLCDAQCHKSC